MRNDSRNRKRAFKNYELQDWNLLSWLEKYCKITPEDTKRLLISSIPEAENKLKILEACHERRLSQEASITDATAPNSVKVKRELVDQVFLEEYMDGVIEEAKADPIYKEIEYNPSSRERYIRDYLLSCKGM